MDELSQDKEIVKLEKKLFKDGQKTFAEEVRAMPESALNDCLLRLSKAQQENITAKNNDQKLKDAKAEVNSLQGPYNEFKRKNQEKSRFVSLLLQDKFGE